MRSETHTRYRSRRHGNRTDMSHDQLRALMEHAHDAGCVNLSAFTQLLTEMDLDEEEISALYEQLDERGIELTDEIGRASCRERVRMSGCAAAFRRKTMTTGQMPLEKRAL